MTMRTHRRRQAARQLIWARWLAELRAELEAAHADWTDDALEACPACDGDGCDPMTDYALPCELCGGDGRA